MMGIFCEPVFLTWLHCPSVDSLDWHLNGIIFSVLFLIKIPDITTMDDLVKEALPILRVIETEVFVEQGTRQKN